MREMVRTPKQLNAGDAAAQPTRAGQGNQFKVKPMLWEVVNVVRPDIHWRRRAFPLVLASNKHTVACAVINEAEDVANCRWVDGITEDVAS